MKDFVGEKGATTREGSGQIFSIRFGCIGPGHVGASLSPTLYHDEAGRVLLRIRSVVC